MARRRLKLTPFARFFIFLIIAAPLAYLGASYYNGEDGWENVRGTFRKLTGEQEETVENAAGETERNEIEADAVIARLRKELELEKRRVDSLQQENLQLKASLDSINE